MGRVKRMTNLESLEIEAAASILIYDREEIETFLKLYHNNIANNQEIGVSGPFNTFIGIIEKAVEKGLFDFEGSEDVKIDDITINGVDKREKLMRFITLNGNLIYDLDQKDRFKQWLSSVFNADIEEGLAYDVINQYIWEHYKSRITEIDKTDEDFANKIKSIPKPLNIKSKDDSKIIGIGDVDLEQDNKNNKLFSTGIDELDQYVKPKGTGLMVIAARPSVGKSLFMLQQAIENARGGKRIGVDGQLSKPKKTLFISLEMNSKDVTDRTYAYLIQDNLRNYSSADYKKKTQEIRNDEKYKNIHENLKLMVSKESNANMLLKEIEQSIVELGIENVYLDYLQLLKFTGMDEWGSIRQATNQLKNLAFRHNVLIVTGSQVSRQSTVEGLSLEGLFGGSTIEADSDIVIGMEAVRERRSDKPSPVNLKILKNREGSMGTIKTDIDYSCGQIMPHMS